MCLSFKILNLFEILSRNYRPYLCLSSIDEVASHIKNCHFGDYYYYYYYYYTPLTFTTHAIVSFANTRSAARFRSLGRRVPTFDPSRAPGVSEDSLLRSSCPEKTSSSPPPSMSSSSSRNSSRLRLGSPRLSRILSSWRMSLCGPGWG